MPRTVDGIVEAHRLATERRQAGRPVWDLKLDVSPWFHNEELTFEERVYLIVRKIRSTPWPERNEELPEILEELAEVQSVDEFDSIWNDIYDLADLDPEYRVWIKTR